MVTMTRTEARKTATSTIGVLSVALTLGSFVGVLTAGIDIIVNRYYLLGLHNLILLEVQSHVNWSALLSILVATCSLFLRKGMQLAARKFRLSQLAGKLRDPAVSSALLISLMISISVVIVLLGSLPSVILFVKSTFLYESLRALSSSARKVLLACLSGLLAVSFAWSGTFILSKVKLFRRVSPMVLRVATSAKGVVATTGIIVTIVGFNASIAYHRQANAPTGPNLVLISIDTTRADHLSGYGYPRLTTPNIDRLAREGILFSNAFSQAPWTLPSMASMHTGLYPSEHGATDSDLKISDRLGTLAEYMRDGYYKTIAVVSHTFVNRMYGFSQGFDVFDQDYVLEHDELTSALITDRAIEYIREYSDQPFFIWLHYFDPHNSYVRHPKYGYASGYDGELPSTLDIGYLRRNRDELSDADVQYVRDVYDEEISFTDEHIGLLLNFLEEIGLEERTAVIVTADHGEAFMERGKIGHGGLVYQELVRVPLILKIPSHPASSGVIVSSNAEVRSIARTALEICQIDNNPFEGYSLLDLVADQPADSYALIEGNDINEPIERQAIVLGKLKLIRNVVTGRSELYDLVNDPAESENIYAQIRQSDDQLIQMLELKLSAGLPEQTGGRTQRLGLTSEEIERLRSLGYLR